MHRSRPICMNKSGPVSSKINEIDRYDVCDIEKIQIRLIDLNVENLFFLSEVQQQRTTWPRWLCNQCRGAE